MTGTITEMNTTSTTMATTAPMIVLKVALEDVAEAFEAVQ